MLCHDVGRVWDQESFWIRPHNSAGQFLPGKHNVRHVEGRDRYSTLEMEMGQSSWRGRKQNVERFKWICYFVQGEFLPFKFRRGVCGQTERWGNEWIKVLSVIWWDYTPTHFWQDNGRPLYNANDKYPKEVTVLWMVPDKFRGQNNLIPRNTFTMELNWDSLREVS